jgi:hypothetical protein
MQRFLVVGVVIADVEPWLPLSPTALLACPSPACLDAVTTWVAGALIYPGRFLRSCRTRRERSGGPGVLMVMEPAGAWPASACVGVWRASARAAGGHRRAACVRRATAWSWHGHVDGDPAFSVGLMRHPFRGTEVFLPNVVPSTIGMCLRCRESPGGWIRGAPSVGARTRGHPLTATCPFGTQFARVLSSLFTVDTLCLHGPRSFRTP